MRQGAFRTLDVELVGYPDMSHMMDWPDLGTPKQRLDRLGRTVGWFEQFL